MGSEDFAVFKQRLLDRHTNAVTSGSSTLGELTSVLRHPAGAVRAEVDDDDLA